MLTPDNEINRCPGAGKENDGSPPADADNHIGIAVQKPGAKDEEMNQKADTKIDALDPETLWTAKELAHYLKCSEHTVRDKTYRGLIPSIKIPGGGVRYRKEQIDEWLINQPARRRSGER